MGTRAVLEEIHAEELIKSSADRVVHVDPSSDLSALMQHADASSVFRFRERSRGWREVAQHFIAWLELLESDARADFADPLAGDDIRAYELAAKYSHRITAIHPFPDFNGRLSRLVMSACMERAGVPFPLSIKCDKKGRERYLYALRRADKGDLRPMTMLVARAVVEGFEDIDAKLELAGLPRLLPA